MANMFLNLMSAVSESDQLSACLELCDVMDIGDIILIDDLTLDNMENYVKQKCVRMSIKERKKYLDSDFLNTPLNFMFSPAIRQRILNVCSMINTVYKSLPIGTANIDDSFYDIIKQFMSIMSENQRVRLSSLIKGRQSVDVDCQSQEIQEVVYKIESVDDSERMEDFVMSRTGKISSEFPHHCRKMSVLESMAREFLPLINDTTIPENSILSGPEVMIKLEKIYGDKPIFKDDGNTTQQKLKEPSNIIRGKLVIEKKIFEHKPKKITKKTKSNQKYVALSLKDVSDDGKTLSRSDIPLKNLLKRKESWPKKKFKKKRSINESDIKHSKEIDFTSFLKSLDKSAKCINETIKLRELNKKKVAKKRSSINISGNTSLPGIDSLTDVHVSSKLPKIDYSTSDSIISSCKSSESVKSITTNKQSVQNKELKKKSVNNIKLIPQSSNFLTSMSFLHAEPYQTNTSKKKTLVKKPSNTLSTDINIETSTKTLFKSSEISDSVLSSQSTNKIPADVSIAFIEPKEIITSKKKSFSKKSSNGNSKHSVDECINQKTPTSSILDLKTVSMESSQFNKELPENMPNTLIEPQKNNASNNESFIKKYASIDLDMNLISKTSKSDSIINSTLSPQFISQMIEDAPFVLLDLNETYTFKKNSSVKKSNNMSPQDDNVEVLSKSSKSDSLNDLKQLSKSSNQLTEDVPLITDELNQTVKSTKKFIKKSDFMSTKNMEIDTDMPFSKVLDSRTKSALLPQFTNKLPEDNLINKVEQQRKVTKNIASIKKLDTMTSKDINYDIGVLTNSSKSDLKDDTIFSYHSINKLSEDVSISRNEQHKEKVSKKKSFHKKFTNITKDYNSDTNIDVLLEFSNLDSTNNLTVSIQPTNQFPKDANILIAELNQTKKSKKKSAKKSETSYLKDVNEEVSSKSSKSYSTSDSILSTQSTNQLAEEVAIALVELNQANVFKKKSDNIYSKDKISDINCDSSTNLPQPDSTLSPYNQVPKDVGIVIVDSQQTNMSTTKSNDKSDNTCAVDTNFGTNIDILMNTSQLDSTKDTMLPPQSTYLVQEDVPIIFEELKQTDTFKKKSSSKKSDNISLEINNSDTYVDGSIKPLQSESILSSTNKLPGDVTLKIAGAHEANMAKKKVSITKSINITKDNYSDNNTDVLMNSPHLESTNYSILSSKSTNRVSEDVPVVLVQLNETKKSEKKSCGKKSNNVMLKNANMEVSSKSSNSDSASVSMVSPQSIYQLTEDVPIILVELSQTNVSKTKVSIKKSDNISSNDKNFDTSIDDSSKFSKPDSKLSVKFTNQLHEDNEVNQSVVSKRKSTMKKSDNMPLKDIDNDTIAQVSNKSFELLDMDSSLSPQTTNKFTKNDTFTITDQTNVCKRKSSVKKSDNGSSKQCVSDRDVKVTSKSSFSDLNIVSMTPSNQFSEDVPIVIIELNETNKFDNMCSEVRNSDTNVDCSVKSSQSDLILLPQSTNQLPENESIGVTESQLTNKSKRRYSSKKSTNTTSKDNNSDFNLDSSVICSQLELNNDSIITPLLSDLVLEVVPCELDEVHQINKYKRKHSLDLPNINTFQDSNLCTDSQPLQKSLKVENCRINTLRSSHLQNESVTSEKPETEIKCRKKRSCKLSDDTPLTDNNFVDSKPFDPKCDVIISPSLTKGSSKMVGRPRLKTVDTSIKVKLEEIVKTTDCPYEKITELCKSYFVKSKYTPHKDYSIIFPEDSKPVKKPFAYLDCHICKKNAHSPHRIKFNISKDGSPVIYNIMNHLKVHFKEKK